MGKGNRRLFTSLSCRFHVNNHNLGFPNGLIMPYEIDKNLVKSVLILLDVETVRRGEWLIDNYIGRVFLYRSNMTVENLNKVIDAHDELRVFLQDIQTKWIVGNKRIRLYIHFND